MIYQKFQPAEILTPFVECYFAWESGKPLDKELVVESPPTSFCGIAINYGDPYFLQNKKYERLEVPQQLDRKSTRLNSSHSQISYAVFCLKKKKNKKALIPLTQMNVN